MVIAVSLPAVNLSWLTDSIDGMTGPAIGAESAVPSLTWHPQQSQWTHLLQEGRRDLLILVDLAREGFDLLFHEIMDSLPP